MSCGTGRISQGIPPKTKDNKEWDGKRAINTPQVWDTITKEEAEEIYRYTGVIKDNE